MAIRKTGRAPGRGGARTPRQRRPALSGDLLLDTHTFLWFVTGSPQLTAAVRQAIEDPANTVFVSAASAWEIAIKRALGKLPETARFTPSLTDYLHGHGFTTLAVTVDHAERAGALASHHRDP